jgi:RNA polymerase sigma-70 factor (ECF subfamily)
LYRFAILRVKDPSVAEDLVQETFLAALKGIDRFKGGSALRTWMVGILKHKIIDYFRRNRPEISASDLGTAEDETDADRLDRADTRENSHPAWHEDPDNLLRNKEFWDVLMVCLDGLPEAHRRAFSLREIDGIKGEDICKILEITSTNLWVMLHRARGKLQNCLENNWFKAR